MGMGKNGNMTLLLRLLESGEGVTVVNHILHITPDSWHGVDCSNISFNAFRSVLFNSSYYDITDFRKRFPKIKYFFDSATVLPHNFDIISGDFTIENLPFSKDSLIDPYNLICFISRGLLFPIAVSGLRTGTRSNFITINLKGYSFQYDVLGNRLNDSDEEIIIRKIN